MQLLCSKNVDRKISREIENDLSGKRGVNIKILRKIENWIIFSTFTPTSHYVPLNYRFFTHLALPTENFFAPPPLSPHAHVDAQTAFHRMDF